MSFKLGDVVVFTPDNFHQKWWNSLNEKEKLRLYGAIGYGSKKPKLYVYICPVNNSDGSEGDHCVLVSLKGGHIQIMRHHSEFRKATEEEM